MSTKTNNTARKSTAKTAPAVVDQAPVAALDWTREIATMEQAAKEKAGSRGNELGKVAKFMAGQTPAAALLRDATGLAGAKMIIDLPRNVLAKLPKLANRLHDGQPWCALEALHEDGKRTADASVAVALGNLGAGDARQKSIIAAAIKRYPGGGNAQMPAALTACEVFGIVKRKDTGSARNAEYVIADQQRADALIPKATTVG